HGQTADSRTLRQSRSASAPIGCPSLPTKDRTADSDALFDPPRAHRTARWTTSAPWTRWAGSSWVGAEQVPKPALARAERAIGQVCAGGRAGLGMVLDRLPALPLGRFLDRQAGRAARVRFGQAPARLLAPGGRRVMSAWPAAKNMSRKWLDLS